jgi:hypothetical protein
MKGRKMRPDWGTMALIVIGIVAAGWLEVRQPLPRSGHIMAELVLLMLFWWLVNWWLRENEIALMMQERERRKQEALRQEANGYFDRARKVKPFRSRLWQRSPGWMAALAASLEHIFRGS